MSHPPHRPRATLAFTVAVTALVLMTSPASSQQQNPPPCTAPEHRQFDFWLGIWDVTGQNGQQAGTNVIETAMGGCVLHESYTGSSGYFGESFNVYDANRGVWHQSWVDNTGLLLTLEGVFEDGRMVLAGETVGPDGTVSEQRITWSIVDGDPYRVRQLWQTRTDGGDWTVAFDGLYVRTSG